MNALYVTVSIPLLLVLAGFNHAHGLTTFGKPNSQGTQQPQRPPVKPVPCTSQANCTIIKDATCIKGHCLCGNNNNPVDGKCSALKQGAHHVCKSDDSCVESARCVPAMNKTKAIVGPNEKVCMCEEGLIDTQDGSCGGQSNFIVLPGLLLLLNGFSRILY